MMTGDGLRPGDPEEPAALLSGLVHSFLAGSQRQLAGKEALDRTTGDADAVSYTHLDVYKRQTSNPRSAVRSASSWMSA